MTRLAQTTYRKRMATQPAIIVLGAPGTPVPNDGLKFRCMTCLSVFSISRKTRDLREDLRAARMLYVIICHPCWTIMERDAPQRITTEPLSADVGRIRAGLDRR